MKIVLIDNPTPFAKKLSTKYNTIDIFPKEDGDSTYNIVAGINQIIQNLEDQFIILLNADLKDGQLKTNLDLWGIEVLKEIRSNHANLDKLQKAHVVLYSFFNLKKIIDGKPDRLIITAPGTTLTTIKDLDRLDFENLSSQTISNLDLLKPYFRIGFTLPDQRHGYANWWGAYKMVVNYNTIFKSNYSKSLVNSLQETKDYQIYAAEFLYGVQEKKLPFALINKVKKIICTNQFNAKKDWKSVLNNFFDKRIALIDDEAMKISQHGTVGWKEIYSMLLFGEKNRVDAIPSQWNDDQIVANISDDHNLVLLDLHLEVADFDKPVEQTRGAKILKKIKKKYPFLPVIITTASNKAVKRKKMRNIGCDAFWIKEGIDERLSAEESMNRILELFLLVKKARGRQYDFLAKCSKMIQSIHHKDTLWWENWNWSDKNKQVAPVKIKRHKIIKILEQELLILRSYLQHELMGEGLQTVRDESVWLTGVVVNLANILEMIHQTGNKSQHSKIMRNRGDMLGVVLYQERHKAAHYRKEGKIKTGMVSAFIKHLLCYLFVQPSQELKKINPFRTSASILVTRNSNYKNVLNTYF